LIFTSVEWMNTTTTIHTFIRFLGFFNIGTTRVAAVDVAADDAETAAVFPAGIVELVVTAVVIVLWILVSRGDIVDDEGTATPPPLPLPVILFVE
jgi:hypothetical protein